MDIRSLALKSIGTLPSPSTGRLVPVIHNWFIVSLLLFFGHARVVSREVLYHILSHWCDRKEIIVAINKFIEYVANSWYCKLFDCLSGFVESKIP